jgi:hypothetical protein
MNEESLWKPALIGGVILGVLSSLPVISCLCCAWVIAGGVIAARVYVKSSSVPVKLGRGVQLGLLTGVIGSLVIGLFSIPKHMLMDKAGFMDQLRQSMQQIPNLPPESRQMFEAFVSNTGLIYAVEFISTLVFCCLLAMVGGAIGVALFEKRKPGDGMIPPPPVQPPTVE